MTSSQPSFNPKSREESEKKFIREFKDQQKEKFKPYSQEEKKAEACLSSHKDEQQSESNGKNKHHIRAVSPLISQIVTGQSLESDEHCNSARGDPNQGQTAQIEKEQSSIHT